MSAKKRLKHKKNSMTEESILYLFALPSAIIAPTYVLIWLKLYPEIHLYEKLTFLTLSLLFLPLYFITRRIGIARRHIRLLYHIVYYASSLTAIYFTALHGYSEGYSVTMLLIAFYVSITFEKLPALMLFLSITLLSITVSLFHWYSMSGSVNRSGIILLCSSLAFSYVSILIRRMRIKDSKSLFTMAHYDPITNLANRNYLEKHLNSTMLFSTGTTALMFLDLDKFKIINDTMGHGFGDLVLKKVAQEIKQCIYEDDFMARYGGDEFIIVQKNTNRHKATETAKQIIDRFTMPLQINTFLIDLSVSIGISFYPQDASDADTLINNADVAMYYIKSRGKNNYGYYKKEMSEKLHRRFQLEHGLKNALKKKEFVLYYQPKVDIRSGKIIGAEALIRWKHPIYGMISPKDFIPLAEESGHIVSIGEWVIRTACRQNKAWQNLGYEAIPISVNVSYHQLIDANFIPSIQKILEESRMAPEYLELEITESVLRDSSEITEIFSQLKEHHIHISIDDFGVGYSSLRMLQYIDIDSLKIDMSFTRDIPANQKAAAIIKAIVELGDNLNYSITAEGVESWEQAEFLYRSRCHLLQGYLFSKPIEAKEFQTLLDNPRCFLPSSKSK